MLAVSLLSCETAPVKTTDGFKTARVVAKYMPDAAIGYSIEITFPKNPDDADRAEIDDILQDFDCYAYEGGGSPGAPQYVKCKGVKDELSADKKLTELLPALETLMERITRRAKIEPSAKTLVREAARPKTLAEWIERENAKREPCKTDGWRGAGTDGYYSWDESCVKGVVVYTDTTKETQEREVQQQAHKNELAHALVTRTLTDKEFAEVAQYGRYLLVAPMQPYYADDIERQFQNMLAIQKTLRAKKVMVKEQ
jgi:hypothetical protein